MDNTPRLSIIVPAYNVECFLDKCLASICNQTFRDFEVLLINDGSTDSTSRLCEVWAAKDARVRLINQKNCGLAAVRNVGVREARAALIMFVDSDDYLELDAIEILLQRKEETGVEIVIGHQVFEYPDHTEYHPQLPKGVISGKKAYKELLYDLRLNSFLWAKIYDRGVFDGIVFPEDLLLEDYSVMHKLILNARRVAVTERVVYHYVRHEGAVLMNPALSSPRNALYLKFFLERLEHARAHLSRHDFAIFRYRMVRRMIRTLAEEQKKGHYPEGSRECLLMYRVISTLCGREVTPSDYPHLLRWSRRKEWLAKLFCW